MLNAVLFRFNNKFGDGNIQSSNAVSGLCL